MMMDEGFQEEGEAAGKWRRASLSSVQLSTYFVGVLDVSDIRRDYEAKRGGRVNERELHDAMLSFGFARTQVRAGDAGSGSLSVLAFDVPVLDHWPVSR